ncbi:MAG TPA: hypothetical protein VHR55_10840 [Candidatus Limnocylindria bacterium]|nr:hypothetical protein [Candidatus Limnocylindria bacterium]
MSGGSADPERRLRRLTGMALPELVSLIAATVLVIATLAFIAPEP